MQMRRSYLHICGGRTTLGTAPVMACYFTAFRLGVKLLLCLLAELTSYNLVKWIILPYTDITRHLCVSFRGENFIQKFIA